MAEEYIEFGKILGLFSIDKTDDSCPILHAISLDNDILENMLKINVSKEDTEYAFFKIRPIKMFSVIKLLDPSKMAKFIKLQGDKKDMFITTPICIKKFLFDKKTFGLNIQTKNKGYEQAIIVFLYGSDHAEEEFNNYIKEIHNESIFKDNISKNSIMFDTYYYNGLMNA